jgi:hypothetical protein
MYKRQPKRYYNMLFTLQAAKMKSWLLILGVALTMFNCVAPAVAESKLINVSQ